MADLFLNIVNQIKLLDSVADFIPPNGEMKQVTEIPQYRSFGRKYKMKAKPLSTITLMVAVAAIVLFTSGLAFAAEPTNTAEELADYPIFLHCQFSSWFVRHFWPTFLDGWDVAFALKAVLILVLQVIIAKSGVSLVRRTGGDGDDKVLGIVGGGLTIILILCYTGSQIYDIVTGVKETVTSTPDNEINWYLVGAIVFGVLVLIGLFTGKLSISSLAAPFRVAGTGIGKFLTWIGDIAASIKDGEPTGWQYAGAYLGAVFFFGNFISGSKTFFLGLAICGLVVLGNGIHLYKVGKKPKEGVRCKRQIPKTRRGKLAPDGKGGQLYKTCGGVYLGEQNCDGCGFTKVMECPQCPADNPHTRKKCRNCKALLRFTPKKMAEMMRAAAAKSRAAAPNALVVETPGVPQGASGTFSFNMASCSRCHQPIPSGGTCSSDACLEKRKW